MQSKALIVLTICTLLIVVGDTVQVQARCNVDNCEICDPGASCICWKCKENYALNILGECSKQVPCNVAQCSICSSSSPNVCMRCEDWYMWDDDSQACEKKPECNIRYCEYCYSDNASKCLFCSISYNSTEDDSWCYRDSHTCHTDHCRECDWCKKGACATCHNGFHVTDEGTCAKGGSGDLAAYRMMYLLYFAVILITVVIVAQKV